MTKENKKTYTAEVSQRFLDKVLYVQTTYQKIIFCYVDNITTDYFLLCIEHRKILK